MTKNETPRVVVTDELRKEAEAEWDHLLNKTFSRHMAIEHLAQFALSHRTAAEAASREEWPSALLEQSCCLGLIGKNVIIDCETRAEAEEILDWLCGERTARAALTPATGGEDA